MNASTKAALRNEAEEICGCILDDCPIDGNLLTRLRWIRDNGMGRGTDGEIDASELDALIANVEAAESEAKALARAALANIKPGRSAWSRAVHTYAVELVESLDASDDLSNENLLNKALLNGADDWRQYSEGGCALVYDADIAERLCSPSELKRVRGGERPPNSRENWIECQARALAQAAALVRRAYRKAAAIEGGAL